MEGFDLRAARLLRLKQDLGALLPDDDPLVRQTIFRLLSIGLRDGLDPFPRFRDEVQRRSKGRAHVPAASERSSSSALEIAVLGAPQRATLWPYRPKRLPGELLSSWLWRIACGLGAPPPLAIPPALPAEPWASSAQAFCARRDWRSSGRR